MTDWKTVRGDQAPALLDTTSSSSTVYERRNVTPETVDMGDTKAAQGYVYEERTYTKAEYEAMTSPAQQAIMQSMSALELQIAMLG